CCCHGSARLPCRRSSSLSATAAGAVGRPIGSSGPRPATPTWSWTPAARGA
ncbi:MAG: Acetyl xylan esterase, partial [uncultured Thermomicrobiales bacterium]